MHRPRTQRTRNSRQEALTAPLEREGTEGGNCCNCTKVHCMKKGHMCACNKPGDRTRHARLAQRVVTACKEVKSARETGSRDACATKTAPWSAPRTEGTQLAEKIASLRCGVAQKGTAKTQIRALAPLQGRNPRWSHTLRPPPPPPPPPTAIAPSNRFSPRENPTICTKVGTIYLHELN
jgi:hypothetical protein